MLCRKLVVLNGADGYSGVKGMLALSTDGGQTTLKIDVYELPAGVATYVLCLLADGKIHEFPLQGAGRLDDRKTVDFAVSPASKIDAALASGGRLVAHGANFQSHEQGTAEQAKAASAANPAVYSAATAVTPAPQKNQPTNFSPDPPLQKQTLFSSEIPPKKKTEYEESLERMRQSYDDERIADFDYYPPGFQPQFQGRKRTEPDVTGAEEDAWGGYNTVYQPRPRAQSSRPQAHEPPRFFTAVKETLDRLFAHAPPEPVLNQSLAPSRWVRVDYKTGLYYCVGLIGKLPDYIGYAVPGSYSLNPPRQMAGICKWLPLSAAEPKGDGYWMMFQDAVTGKSVDIT